MHCKYNLWTLILSLVFVLACDAPKPGSGPGAKSASQKMTDQQSTAASQAISDSKKGSAKPSKLEKVALQLNWYPEAEHGGFYAAQVHGIFKKYGLDVDILAGGPSTTTPQELLLGRIQFGIANADDVLMGRSEGVPLVTLMAPIQNGPRCIMVRKDSGITTFADLKNIKLQINAARPYVPFLKSKGYLTEGVEIVPYFGTVAQLVADKSTAAQGYCFSEPFMAKQEGVEVVQLMMSDIGYNPYCSVLMTTEKYMSKNGDLCHRMTQACIEGWKKYFESPAETNKVILAKNKQGLKQEALDYGVDALKPLCIQGTDDSAIGLMTAERWNELSSTLVSLKLIDASKASVDQAYTLKYLEQINQR